MGCYHLDLPSGGTGIICGKLGKPCASCSRPADYLCDFPVGKGKTCDRRMCEKHAAEVGPDLHYCTAHHAQWERFRASGGVERELANVVPYRQPGLF